MRDCGACLAGGAGAEQDAADHGTDLMRTALGYVLRLAVAAGVLAALLSAQTPAHAAPPCDDREYLRSVDRLHLLPEDYEPVDLIDLRGLGLPVIGYRT